MQKRSIHPLEYHRHPGLHSDVIELWKDAILAGEAATIQRRSDGRYSVVVDLRTEGSFLAQ